MSIFTGPGGLDGLTANTAATSALSILQINPNAADGLYWIRAPYINSGTATQVYCDMTTDGGGWMLYACKVNYNSITVNGSLSATAYSTINADTNGKVPTSSFEELMWRFSDKAGKPYVTKYTKQDDTGAAKSTWNSFIVNPSGNYSAQAVGGWRRSTNGGFTWSSVYNMQEFFFYTSGGAMSEQHGNPPGSDQYLDLWSATDGTNSYTYTDNSTGNGTKCIAGYCYFTEPVLFFWR